MWEGEAGPLAGFGAVFAAVFAALCLSRAVSRQCAAELAGVACSFVHGSACALGAALALWRRAKEAEDVGWTQAVKGLAYAPNDAFEEALMQFSFAYFAVDTVYLLAFGRKSASETRLLIAHHVATSSYAATSARFGVGAAGVMLLMGLGEFTSPTQNGWVAARALARRDAEASPAVRAAAQTAFAYLNPVYTALFTVNRCVLAPVPIWFLILGLAADHRAGAVPLLCSLWWIGCTVGGTVGGFWWAFKLCKAFRTNAVAVTRERNAKRG